MEVCKKVVAFVSVFALMLSSLTINNLKTKADDYSGLSYSDITNNTNSEFNQNLKGAKYAISSGATRLGVIQFQGAGFSELYIADGGWSADQLKATINGKDVNVEGAGIRVSSVDTFLTQKYNELNVTWNGGQALIIIQCPEIAGGSGGSGGGSGSQTTQAGGQSGGSDVTVTNGGTETTKAPAETTKIPDATELPQKTFGVVPQVEVGEYQIHNSVLLAWASVMQEDNPNYDPSIYAYNVYVYKGTQLVTKVYNVTNGCILGGLSAGSYQFGLAAVNAMGEGPMSNLVSAEITGYELDYTPASEYKGPKIPDGFSLTSSIDDFKENVPEELQINKLWVAWAASDGNPEAPGYDPSVVGYNVYVFKKTDDGRCEQYRKHYVDGASTNTVMLEYVSAGEYVCFVTAVDTNGNESGMAAPGISLASSVEIEGEEVDNAEKFPEGLFIRPELPVGLVINGAEEGVGDGFSIAWSGDADTSDVYVNLFVDGTCIKFNCNDGPDPTYHELRLKPGEYTVEVRTQFKDSGIESFPKVKKIKVEGTGTASPDQIPDPWYYNNVQETTTEAPTEEVTTVYVDDQTTNYVEDTTKAVTTERQTTQRATTKAYEEDTDYYTDYSEETTEYKPPVTQKPTQKVVPPVPTNKPSVGKASVKKATKKKSAKKASIVLKKVNGASKYQIRYGIGKSMKKGKTCTVSALKFKIKGLKKKKTYYIKARAIAIVGGKTYYGAWSGKKKIKMK